MAHRQWYNISVPDVNSPPSVDLVVPKKGQTMNRWFRFYDEAINDPKILKLSDKLHRIWIGILCAASKNNGELPPIEDLSLMLRIKPEKMKHAVESLIKSGLVDIDGVIFRPHNWDKRQFKSDVSTERVKRFRNSKVTPPETETETETETERKKEVAPSVAPSILGGSNPAPDVDYYRRARKILGDKGGGIAKQLLVAKGNDFNLARSALEMAASKAEPSVYLRKVIYAIKQESAKRAESYIPGWEIPTGGGLL
jgi:hypothetical protein